MIWLGNGLAVITGTEDRQHAYVALTRGTDANLAYVFTLSPQRADPVPGPRPAPELTRYDRRHSERPGDPAPVTPPALPGSALSVLAAVLDHDGQIRTFTERLADRQSLTVPTPDPGYGDLCQAFPPWPRPARDAILPPPNASLQKIRAGIGNLRDIGEVDHLASYRLVSDKGGNIQLVTQDQAVNLGNRPGQLQLVAVMGDIIEPFAARAGVLA